MIRIKKRDELTKALTEAGIPYGIYYPVPLHKQPVFGGKANSIPLPETEKICNEVLALPMHTELTPTQQERIADIVTTHATSLIHG